MKTFCLAFVLTAIVAALLADVTAQFVGQQPVFPAFPGGPTRRPTPGRKGQPCSPNAPCGSGLCCLKSSNGYRPYSTCQPKGEYGMTCSEESIKGGTYIVHCPCLQGLRCRDFGENRHICVTGK
uniref:Prokineticin domain-containing protein n=1 Tax=Ixodes ricinus TaxID=34613 RepID=V5HR37_IXORI